MSTVSETAQGSGGDGRVTRRIVVDGRVQGVGYRYYVAGEAEALAISGWVRNRFDGSVEVLACAPPDRVEALVGRLWRGPRLARVVTVDVGEAPPFEGEGFRVLSSV